MGDRDNLFLETMDLLRGDLKIFTDDTVWWCTSARGKGVTMKPITKVTSMTTYGTCTPKKNRSSVHSVMPRFSRGPTSKDTHIYTQEKSLTSVPVKGAQLRSTKQGTSRVTFTTITPKRVSKSARGKR